MTDQTLLEAVQTALITLNFPRPNTDQSIHDQAQEALITLNFRHPDGASAALRAVLARLAPDGPDAEVFTRAIDWLEAIAVDITRVEDMLCDANFTFGKIQK